MILTFLSANRLLFCFLLSTYQWKKKIVHSHIQEMACKLAWQFLSKLSASSLSSKSVLGTFLSEWSHSRSHIKPKQAKRFGKGRKIRKTRKTRKDREVKVTDASIENVGNGRYVWQNLTGYRAVAVHYLKPDTAIRFVSASLWFLHWSITIYEVT